MDKWHVTDLEELADAVNLQLQNMDGDGICHVDEERSDTLELIFLRVRPDEAEYLAEEAIEAAIADRSDLFFNEYDVQNGKYVSDISVLVHVEML